MKRHDKKFAMIYILSPIAFRYILFRLKNLKTLLTYTKYFLLLAGEN